MAPALTLTERGATTKVRRRSRRHRPGRQGGRFVRIGFDMLAVQSPHHGQRGIGRYSQHLVSALLARDPGHEYFLYAYADLPTDRIPSGRRARLRRLGSATVPDG